MKIVVLAETFSKLSETFVYDQASSLQAEGLDVTVVTLNRQNPEERPYEPVETLRSAPSWTWSGLIERFAIRILQLTGQATPHITYRPSLRKVLAALKPDVVHAHFGPAMVFALPVVKSLDIPLVVSFHGYDATFLARVPSWRKTYAKMLPSVACATAPSGYLRERVIDLGGIPDRTVVLRNGLDLTRIAYADPSLRFDGKEVCFLFVGRLVGKKDPVGLVRAFAACKALVAGRVRVRLVMAGGGSLENDLAEAVAEAGVASDVTLLGAVPHAETLQLYQQAHIYVQHSVVADNGDEEGLPVSITEAAVAGLPVISTRHSGIPEVVSDGVSGYLVDEGDYQAMGERMAFLALNPGRWHDMGLAGHTRVKDEFSKESVVRELRELLLHVSEGRAPKKSLTPVTT